MNKESIDYTATQTADGFLVEFHDSIKPCISITDKDFHAFAMRINEGFFNAKEITFTEKEEILFNLWQLLLIPENTKH
ncbi:MAG TPA: hypothetical protein VGA95_09565 [Thermodesulfobacteriota bacterium]|jgi:hypothetical protein